MKNSHLFVFWLLIAALAFATPASAAYENDSEARYLISQDILGYLRNADQEEPTINELYQAASLYPEYPRSINDSAGNTFVFYQPVKKVVILNNNAADALTVIGTDDLIVGVAESLKENSLQFPETSTLPSVGKWMEPDIEAILALDPDLVIAYGSWPDPEKLETHLPNDIPVIRMDFYKTETYRSEMEAVGHLFNKEENADEYLEWYDHYFDLVNERIQDIPEEERVRVYAEAGEGQSFGRRAYSTGTGLHDLLVAAGGVNIAEEYIDGYADVETEWIIYQKPESVLIWSGKGGYKTDERDLVISQYNGFTGITGSDKIPAVSEGRVYVITSSFAFGSSSPAALVQVGSWLYPSRFEDIDAQSVHEQYLEKYTQTAEDVWDEGTFYYPDGKD